MTKLTQQEQERIINGIMLYLHNLPIKNAFQVLQETKIRIEESHLVDGETVIEYNKLLVNEDAERQS